MKKSIVWATLAGLGLSATSAFAQCNSLVVGSTPNASELGIDDVGNHCDDCATLIALPFTVSLYGGSYSQAYVGSNGQMHFGTYTGSPFGNTCTLPSATFTGGPTIFPHWDDLMTTAGGIFTSTSGTPGSQRFNVTWQFGYFPSTTVVGNFTVSFYENQSFFDVFYDLVPNSGVSATAAVQANSTGGSSVTTYSCNAGNLISGTAIRYSCPTVANPSCALSLAPTSGPTGTIITASATVFEGAPSSPITSVSLNAAAVDGGVVAMTDMGGGLWQATVTVGPLAGTGNQTLTSTVTDALSRSSTCDATFNVIPPPPVNDECSGALQANLGSNSYDTTSSTTSSANGSPCGAIGTDVWHYWDANCSGQATITTCGMTTVDTAIAIYDDCNSATAVACNDDACGLQTTVTWFANQGTRYYFRLGDFAGGNPHAGTYTLSQDGAGNPTVTNATADLACADIGATVTISAQVNASNCPPDPIASVTADCTALDAGTINMTDQGGGFYVGQAVVGSNATGGTITVTATSQASVTGSANTNGVAINAADTVGDLPSTAMVMSGDGSSLASISGTLGANCTAGNDADMYQINLCDPANFSASACGTAFDTQLFLFDENGFGIAVNDDFCGLQSTLTNLFTSSRSPGIVYLAISGYNMDPVDEGGQLIWNNTPFASERAPDGPGAAGQVSSWFGAGGGGDYTIALTGVCTVAGGGGGCDPDYDQNGVADQDDVTLLINIIATGDGSQSPLDADFDCNGVADQDDVTALIDFIASGGTSGCYC